MGNFYANYTVRGPSQQQVAKALAGRSALVTPAKNGCVVVFDKESDGQDQQIIGELAGRLSSELSCPVLAVLNHDDDILWYQLFLNGELTDQYDSSPGYFSPSSVSSTPEGGDPHQLCDVFGVSDVGEVENVLRKSSSDEDRYTFATERHADLVHFLGLPKFAIGSGFGAITDGEFPEGLEEKDLVKTG